MKKIKKSLALLLAMGFTTSFFLTGCTIGNLGIGNGTT